MPPTPNRQYDSIEEFKYDFLNEGDTPTKWQDVWITAFFFLYAMVNKHPSLSGRTWFWRRVFEFLRDFEYKGEDYA